MRRNTVGLATLLALISALGLSAPGARAQEVQLRIGDRLELTVPQRQELDHEMTIDEAGNVELPVVGTINLAGMTLSDAEQSILRRMREVYPSVRRIQLRLIGQESRRIVYVQGQVISPGKYEFREAPTVWQAIREAGGAAAEAAMDAVRIIRAGEESEKTEIVNVQSAIDSGDFTSLPLLRPGDTVIVPERSATAYQGTGAVNVIGGVINPAPYMLAGDKRLIDAIIAAGGTVDNADLTKVRIIRVKAGGGSITMEVDFKKYLEDGDLRHNPLIYPNDTVSVPTHKSFRTILLSPGFLLGLITVTATTITLIITRTY